jgi:polysaccharide pyruvyl transferase CsaB
MAKIVLSGYLGCGNLGDDAVMLGVTETLGSHHEYIVLSGNPGETNKQTGLSSADRKNVKEVDQAISNCDAVVFPGGSVFQDSTSIRTPIYYGQIVKTAKKHGKKVLMLNQGVGPLTTMFGKKFARAAFQAADLVVVRDPQSISTLKELGITKKIHLGADSAFLLKEPRRDDNETSFSVGNMKSIAIAPRAVHRKGIDEAVIFGELCRLLFQAGYAPTLLEMDSAEDGQLIEAITKQQGGRIPQLRSLGNPRIVQQRLSRMDGVIAMRLHAGILAATVGLPPLMISYDPKVTAFARQLDIGSALPIENLTGQRIFDVFQTHHKSIEQTRKVMLAKRAELTAQAMTAIELANQVLG